MDFSLKKLRCCHETRPSGVTGTPVFSWQLLSEKQNVRQTAYELQIILGGETVYSSGIRETDRCTEIAPGDYCVLPGRSYRWSVRVWNNYGESAEGCSSFDTPIDRFCARWVEPGNGGLLAEEMIPDPDSMYRRKPKGEPEERLMPVTRLRKRFSVRQGLVRARAYATAHGVYQLYLNGKRPDTRLYAPEHSSYDKVLFFQNYDITHLLREGQNICGVLLGDGWWGGRTGMMGDCLQYGERRGFLMQIELEYADGTKEQVLSDESMQWNDCGCIRYSDLFIGEKQDKLHFSSRMHDFSDGETWETVTVNDCYGMDNLTPQTGAPVQIIRELPMAQVLKTPKGDKVLDFGQNIAGFVRLRLRAPAGTCITLEHSEVLDAEGNFMNNILGINKDQKDVYICSGQQDVFEPVFSFHGFRYVRVCGLPEHCEAEFTACALSTQMEETMDFSCSDSRLNRLISNVRWSQRGNMLSIPTDCPQRERAGWLGDAQVFAPTAAWNADVNAFFSRWLVSVRAEQFGDGQVPCIVPYSPNYHVTMKRVFHGESSVGWSDACIFVPYAMYLAYGDIQILRENYEMMRRWMLWCHQQAQTQLPEGFSSAGDHTEEEYTDQKHLLNTGWHFGDWLIPSVSKEMSGATASADLTKDVVAPMYYAYELETMAKICDILGLTAEAEAYLAQYRRTRDAFIRTYLKEDGFMEPDLQGLYVLALQFGLIPKEQEESVLEHLAMLITQNGGCLDTGFLSTPFLLDVLMNHGKKDLAYALLYQEKCPSWLYEVRQGATTIWENWAAIAPDGNVSNFSYNHYALGCIADWIYRNIGGIQAVEPGYRKVRICPNPDDSLSDCTIRYESVYGQIQSVWKRENNRFSMEVEIPCNTEAEIILPDQSCHRVGSGRYRYDIAL